MLSNVVASNETCVMKLSPNAPRLAVDSEPLHLGETLHGPQVRPLPHDSTRMSEGNLCFSAVFLQDPPPKIHMELGAVCCFIPSSGRGMCSSAPRTSAPRPASLDPVSVGSSAAALVRAIGLADRVDVVPEVGGETTDPVGTQAGTQAGTQ